jgi:hypothetical protein
MSRLLGDRIPRLAAPEDSGDVALLIMASQPETVSDVVAGQSPGRPEIASVMSDADPACRPPAAMIAGVLMCVKGERVTRQGHPKTCAG